MKNAAPICKAAVSKKSQNLRSQSKRRNVLKGENVRYGSATAP